MLRNVDNLLYLSKDTQHKNILNITNSILESE